MPTFLIPVNTLIFRSQSLQVGVVQDGKVVLKTVIPGHDFGEQMEIVAGLNADDQVILNPPDSLVSGQAGQRRVSDAAGRCRNERARIQFDSAISVMRWTLPPLLAGVLSFAGCAVGPKYKVPTRRLRLRTRRWATGRPRSPAIKIWAATGGRSSRSPTQCPGAADQCLQPESEGRRCSISGGPGRAALLSRRLLPDRYGGSVGQPESLFQQPSAGDSIFNGITFNDFVVPVQLVLQTNALGRVTQNVESYREQAQASSADLAVVNLSMHADLAVDYFAARTLDAEEKLLAGHGCPVRAGTAT